VEKHPTIFKALTHALIGLAGAMMFGGTVNLLAASMRGVSLALGVAGAMGGTSLIGALGALVSPIGIAVAVLGTLAAAAYAFSPLSQKEIDAAKDQGGAKLTPGAQARVNAGELSPNIKTGAHSGSAGKRGDVYLDGKKVGHIVGEHLARGASMPLGSGLFDTGLTQTVPGLN
jgi:hypothetical protein